VDDLTREQVGLSRLPDKRRLRAERAVADLLRKEVPVLNGQSRVVARSIVTELERRGLLEGGRVQ
jgi:hypothetical protein